MRPPFGYAILYRMLGENGREIVHHRGQIAVLVPAPVPTSFDYLLPEGETVAEGAYVEVPLAGRRVWGVVWGAGTHAEEARLKRVERVATHVPPMAKTMRDFIAWVAWYNFAPPGMVLKMAIFPAACVPPSARERLVRAQPAAPPSPPALSPRQAEAAAYIRALSFAQFGVTVLDGVTGSGKTEVYFDSIEAALREEKQVLVLLPEIGLSVQWLTRFEARFGHAADIWHSQETPARKREVWRRATRGESRVIVGARSALFLPLLELGLIIVDEEHDGSYKQEDGVVYQARDMAVARARAESCQALLVSATPSLETLVNAARGRYRTVHLLARHHGAPVPHARLIDMRHEKMAAGEYISAPLRSSVDDVLAADKQVMLFMNRRGYAPLLLCRACGQRCPCPSCSTSLVVHRSPARLLCHHCGYSARVPTFCPSCQAAALIAYGPGVERVAEEARALWPTARLGVMTSDTMRVMEAEASEVVPVREMIARMTAGDIDILIGTQMIAKGHHFGQLALVGIIDGDMGLMGGDMRANERSYQLLHQLSGRAGREREAGQVWLQTYLPDHPVMQALRHGAREALMTLDAQMREEGGLPPYGRLAALIIDGEDEAKAAQYARDLCAKAQHTPAPGPETPRLLGPAPAPLARLRGRYRFRLLVQVSRQFPLQEWLTRWLPARPPGNLRVKVDIDPYGFL